MNILVSNPLSFSEVPVRQLLDLWNFHVFVKVF